MYRFCKFKYLIGILLLVLCLCLAGCSDPVQRHKVLSLVFDGVPAMPPATERLCEDFATQKVEGEVVLEDESQSTHQRSTHQPYVEKNCKDCHSQNKAVDAGLIVPKQELCLVCHVDFVQGKNVHGPVAVGDCLACHLPHHSEHPSLLIDSPDRICSLCHQEGRLAGAMHDRFINKSINCGECHDPHAGDARYFLK